MTLLIHAVPYLHMSATEECYTSAHEENVRFVYEDFVPIDLEEWWAQQFLAKIENGS
uniref:MAPK regulated corepressor interacting protein 2 n=1 Tax=Crocodylus porosus TaxID=8502 RepID=A0A7M4E1T5_CROPO